MPILNAKIEFTPPRKADPDDIDRAFQRLSNIIAVINAKIMDPDQPSIKYIGDTTAGVAQLSFDPFVEFAAPTGGVILPLANSLTGKRSRLIYIMNSGSGTLTVYANKQDTVDGASSITIATGTFKIFRSNGDTKWMSK